MDDLKVLAAEKIQEISKIREAIGRVIVGQKELVDGLIIGLLTRGHILIEGVPGLAKTSAVKALADSLHADFKRIQFTPDLLPADLVGTEVYRPEKGDFIIKKGPLFNNIILADEINRAPSKVQSALLEAMQERQVTIGDTTFKLPHPFLVLATQNPIDQEGTYPLPEAQVDRFMLKLIVDYPTKQEEKEIMSRIGFSEPVDISAVISPSELDELEKIVKSVYMDERLRDYIVDIVMATRKPEDYGIAVTDYVQFGASPRASIYLSLASRAYAFLQGRAFVTPQDIKNMARSVLRHRIILSYEAEAEGISSDEIVTRILDGVEVP